MRLSTDINIDFPIISIDFVCDLHTAYCSQAVTFLRMLCNFELIIRTRSIKSIGNWGKRKNIAANF